MVDTITTQDELDRLREAEQALRKPTEDLLSEWDKPLAVDENGYITQGVAWFNGPFVTEFWTHARKKPKPVKCTCSCGHRHNKPKGVE